MDNQEHNHSNVNVIITLTFCLSHLITFQITFIDCAILYLETFSILFRLLCAL